MQALVILRRVLQTLHHLPCRNAQIRHRRRASLLVVFVLWGALAVGVRIAGTCVLILGGLVGGPAREVEVHGCGFEEVVVDFVFVVDGSDDVGADVAFFIECLQAAPDACPFSDFQFPFSGDRVTQFVVLWRVGIDPLFYFYGSCAVVEFVGHVCSLGGDVADLADEGYLGYLGAFDGEFGVWVGVGSREDLENGEGAEGVFAVDLLEKG